MAKQKKTAPVTVSKFVGLCRLAQQLGTKQKTNLRVKTEEGTLTLTLDGRMCLNASEAINQAAANGGKLAMKAEGGFGQAEGSGGMAMDGTAATIMVQGMVNGLESLKQKDDADADADAEPKSEQAGV